MIRLLSLMMLVVCGVAGAAHEGHLGINALETFTYMRFVRSDDASGDIIASGKIRAFEADRDTANAVAAGAAYQFIMVSDNTAATTYWYYEDLPGNSYDVYWWARGDTEATQITSSMIMGETLPDSMLNSEDQIINNLIKNQHLLNGEDYASFSSIATCYLAAKDTTDEAGGIDPDEDQDVGTVIATWDWVGSQGYSDSVATTQEAMSDSVWGESSAMEAGQGISEIDITYDDDGAGIGTVEFDIKALAVSPLQMTYPVTAPAVRQPAQLDIPMVGDSLTTWFDFRRIQSLFGAGDNMEWSLDHEEDATPSLNFTGSLTGYTEEEIEDIVGEMVDDDINGIETGITVLYDDPNACLNFIIGADDITGAMIDDETIEPIDIEGGDAAPEYAFPTKDPGGAVAWETFTTLLSADSNALESLFDRAVGPFNRGSGDHSGISFVDDDANDKMIADVQIDTSDDIDEIIQPQDFDHGENPGPSLASFPQVANSEGTEWAFFNLSLLIDAGDYLEWGAIASTATQVTLNVATLPSIDPLDVDYGDIATLTTTVATVADYFSVGGNRWDDGSGNITNDVFPDSCYIASLGTSYVSMTTSLYVGTSASINTTLTVGGNATYSSGLSVGATMSTTAASIGSALYVFGNASINTTLTVGGNATYNSGLTVGATMSTTGAAISGALEVTNVRWDNGFGKILDAAMVEDYQLSGVCTDCDAAQDGEIDAITATLTTASWTTARINAWATRSTASGVTAFTSWTTAYTVDDAANDGDGTTDWTALESIPAGFLDGVDNTSAGGEADRLNTWATNCTATLTTASWTTARINDWATGASASWATIEAMVYNSNATLNTASIATIYTDELRPVSGTSVNIAGGLRVREQITVTTIDVTNIFADNVSAAYDFLGRNSINTDLHYWAPSEVITAGNWIDWTGNTLNVTKDPDASPVADRLNIWATNCTATLTTASWATARINAWATNASASWSTMDAMVYNSNATLNTASISTIYTDSLDITPQNYDGLNNRIVQIVPQEALQVDEEMKFLCLIGSELDPVGAGTYVEGLCIDFSGIGGNSSHLDGIHINMPASTPSHAIHIEGGAPQIDVDYTAYSEAAAEYTIFDIVADIDNLVATSELHAVDVAVAEGIPAGKVVALAAHSYVHPVHQHIGTFTTPSQTEFAGTHDGAWADGIDGNEIFVGNGDYICIGAAAVFGEIEVDMGTAATKNVDPTFWYSTGAATWGQFYPADDTDGFQQDGTIRFDTIAGWTGDGDPGGGDTTAGYYIKIVRTAAPDPGSPTPTTMKTGTLTEYSWNKDGVIAALGFSGTGATITTATIGTATITTASIGTAVITTSLQLKSANDPTTDAEGEIAWDADDEGLEVYSGDESESVVIPIYYTKDATFFEPDGIDDVIKLFRVDALPYPNGIELDKVSLTLDSDAAYTIAFEEWTGDPPVRDGGIATLTTGAADAFMSAATANLANIAAYNYLYVNIPATDVDWAAIQVIFHVSEGN